MKLLNIIYLFVIFFSFNSALASKKCNFIPKGCGIQSRCYYGRLQLGCENGVNGFVDDKYKPKSLFFSKVSTKGLEKKEVTNPGFTLFDLVKGDEKVTNWAQKNGYQFNYKDMILNIDEKEVFYSNALGSELISDPNLEKSEYICNWESDPMFLVSKCSDVKSVCSGKVLCRSGQGVEFNSIAYCLESSAGRDCSSATKCANSNDDISMQQGAERMKSHFEKYQNIIKQNKLDEGRK